MAHDEAKTVTIDLTTFRQFHSVDREILGVLKSLEKPGTGHSFMNDLIETFEREAPLALNGLKVALESGNVRAARHASHLLKGLSCNIGLTRLSAMAEAIEKETEEGMLPNSMGLIEALDSCREEAIHILIRDWKA